MESRVAKLAAAMAFGVALTTLGVGRVAACRCGPHAGDAQAVDAAQVVFEGEVIEVLQADIGPQIVYRFQVDRALKGAVERGEALVFTPWELRGCGIEMAVGDRWVIFATAQDATTFMTNGCSGSRLADRQELQASTAPPEDRGPPLPLMLGGGALAALVGMSAWAFVPRARRPR